MSGGRVSNAMPERVARHLWQARRRYLPLQRSLTLAVALGIDLTLGEPPSTIHPVVWMGRLAGALERRAPLSERARLLYGAANVGLVVGSSALTGGCANAALARTHPLIRLAAMGWLLKSTFALHSLTAAANSVRAALAREDLDAARRGLRSLVSRDSATLTPDLLAAAAVESVAENASDSVVAPLLFYAVAGVPGALAYRAINTLDAMWGYHGAYEHLGKAAARLDDVANLAPARLTGALLLVASWLCAHDAPAGWRIMWRDHDLTASPNAGWPMSAMAGALGIELEKVGHYRLGAPGEPPTPVTIGQAIMIIHVATALALGCCLLGEALWHA